MLYASSLITFKSIDPEKWQVTLLDHKFTSLYIKTNTTQIQLTWAKLSV